MNVESAFPLARDLARGSRGLAFAVHHESARELIAAAWRPRNRGEIIVAETGGAKHPRDAALIHARQEFQVVVAHFERGGEESQGAGANTSSIQRPILHSTDPVFFQAGLEMFFELRWRRGGLSFDFGLHHAPETKRRFLGNER